MAHAFISQPKWDTASLGRPAGASALKNGALSAHLTDCGARRSHWHDLQSVAAGLRQVVAARVVTSALALVLLLGAVWLLR